MVDDVIVNFSATNPSAPAGYDLAKPLGDGTKTPPDVSFAVIRATDTLFGTNKRVLRKIIFGGPFSLAGFLALPGQIEFAGGTIIGWSLRVDQGTISVDLCRKAGVAPPGVPTTPVFPTDKITASAPMTISSGTSASGDAAAVSTWTTALNQWDSVWPYISAFGGGCSQVSGVIWIAQ